MNYAQCVSFGLSGCSITSPETTQQVMHREGVSYGVTGTGDYDDFEGDEPTTNFHNDIWFDRCPTSICGDGYIPPGGHTTSTTYTNNNGPTCNAGLTVISQYIDSANADDGCRPQQCDFGRDADGWCLPPADSDPPIIYVVAQTVREGDGTAQVSVVLSHAGTAAATVDVTSSDSTATAGSDYTAVTSQTVTIASGSREASVAVTILDDDAYEDDETFTMTLSNAGGGAELGSSTSTDITITDDDVPLVGITPKPA